ncbi:MAG: ferritin-like domain-containing protein [Crocosphaera sp.]
MSENHKPRRPSASPENPKDWKIFPRNLTARAAYIVPGNPTVSRPEDGVDNSYPGLEMDVRNLQKYFFPGLYFEVYRQGGARLAGLTPPDRAAQWLNLGLKETDIQDNIYLWVLQGKTASNQDATNPPIIDFVNTEGLGGLYGWRKINALFPGKVAVVIGSAPPSNGDQLEAAKAKLLEGWNSNQSSLQRDSNGKLEYGVLIAQRAPYLSSEGVIDPDVYRPGELTRTLCTPWTYDFRDCQCFYWASNKPDVVAGEDDKYPYLNFQRKNRAVDPQTEDIANSYQARREREIDYAEMMIDWEQLRPVVNGRECGESYKPEAPPPGPILTLEEIKTELTYLATVEHALAVQYLYAYYSVNAPQDEPDDPDLRSFRLWKGANEIFSIAIDEMRHLRWANQVLKLLGSPTIIKRAAKLGRRFELPFYLQSLSSPQLQWFIDVERPSRSTRVGLDGMYVGIQTSLQQLSANEIDPETQRRAVEIIKLIIDEGEGHYVRFSTAQQNLAFFDDAGRGNLPQYIRDGHWSQQGDPRSDVPGGVLYGQPHRETQGTQGAKLQLQSDALYLLLLILLKIAFAMKDEHLSGLSLRQAIACMFKMNDVNFQLATQNMTPLFTIPEWWESDPPVTSADAAHTLFEKAKQRLMESEVLQSAGFGQKLIQRPLPESRVLQNPVLTNVLNQQHQASIDDVIAYFDQAIDQTTYESV